MLDTIENIPMMDRNTFDDNGLRFLAFTALCVYLFNIFHPEVL